MNPWLAFYKTPPRRMIINPFAFAPPSSGAAFSDDFNRADSGSLGANWTAITGTCSIVSNQASHDGASGYKRQLYTGTDTNTDNQYIKATLVTVSGEYPELAFRCSADGLTYYSIYLSGTSVVWSRNSTTTIGSTTLSFSANDSLGVTCTDTGTSTTVRVWKNPTGAAPTSATSWGGASPDITFTDDPATPIDSGKRVGIYGYKISSLIYDNFSGGDIP